MFSTVRNPTLQEQIIINFCSGIIFSPWSRGFVLLLGFAIIVELWYSLTVTNYDIFQRVFLFSIYIVGYLFGRFICKIPVVVDYL